MSLKGDKKFTHLSNVVTATKQEMLERLENMQENMGLSSLVAQQFKERIEGLFCIAEGDNKAQETIAEVASLQVDRFELGLEALEQKKHQERITALANVIGANDNKEISDILGKTA
ncbi:MAG: hypothetical protein N4A38_01840 [Candidatus Gracilibacteria bacterium]|nr:hypothetical protein [Candidatus Gracilibacteria bacterium]